jgi:hypothetical protein
MATRTTARNTQRVTGGTNMRSIHQTIGTTAHRLSISVGVLALAIALLWSLVPSGALVAQASTTAGYRDFSFASPGVEAPTAEKPQNKLWFNDGLWWGSLFNKTNGEYHIYRFNWATQSWTDTGTLIDHRPSSHADTLWDGTHLYIASAVASGNVSDASAYVLRYSYNTGSKQYTLDTGFPVEVGSGGIEALTITKDTLGKLWVTFTQENKVYVNRSLGSDQSWGDAFVPAVLGTSVSADDISAIIAYKSNVGIMWSNQVEGKVYFAVHRDGMGDRSWIGAQVVLSGTNWADDHINIKQLSSDASGSVFAVLKTSLDDGPNPDPSAPQIMVLVLSSSGSWSSHVFGTLEDDHTRPILLIDEEHRDLYVFATAGVMGGTIYYKKTTLDNISFQPGRGTPFIQSTTDTVINNATSTRQNLNSTTGLLVLASDDTTGYYLHNTINLGNAPSPPDTQIDSGPSGTVGDTSASFTFSSTPSGATFECALDGGTFSACASPAEYFDLTSATHTFQVRALNGGGADSTPASRTWTIAPPATGAFSEMVQADAPISYWRLGDTGGTFALDSGSGGNPGSLNGGVTAGVTGALGGDPDTAMAFNGATAYVSVADEPNLNLTGDFAIEAWANPNVVNQSQVVIQKGTTTGYTQWQYRLGITGNGYWRGTVFIGTEAYAVTSSVQPVAGRWDHIVYTRSGSTLQLYVNGVPAPTGTASGFLNSSTGMLAIGRAGSNSSAYFSGAIDEVAIYDHSLSQERVQAHYVSADTPAPGPTDPPETTILTGPDATTTSTSASFTFSSPDPAAAFQCALDGAAFTACGVPATYANLGTGSHTFQVRAVAGALGDPTPAMFTWIITVPTPSGPYADTVITDSPVSYWRLGDGAGTSATDSVGSNTGTLNGNVTPGVIGALTNDADTAMSFDGATAAIQIPDAASLNASTDFAIEAWARPDSITTSQVLVQKSSGGSFSTWQYRLGITSGGLWRGTVFVGSASYAVTSPVQPAVGRWDHIVFTRSGTTLQIYVNGVPATAVTVSGALNSSTGMLAIGRAGSSNADYFDGAVDEVAFYSHALSQSQTQAHFAARDGGAPTPILDTGIDSGPAATTSETSATFAFSATDPSATFQCAVDGGTFAACASPQSYAGLAVGTHTFTVRAIVGGDVDGSPASWTWAILAPVPTGAYTDLVQGDGPISYWRLGDAGGAIADSGTGGNTGTATGGVSTGVSGALAGDTNAAMSFNGSTGYVAINDKASLDQAGDFAIELWARPDSVSKSQVLVQKSSGGSFSGWQYRLGITSGGDWRGTVFVGGSSFAVTSSVRPAVNRWDHLVFQRSGDSLLLYVNGTLAGTASVTGPINTSTGILAIGRAGSSNADYFQGTIDEVALYGHALSPTSIQAHYEAALLP